MEPEILKKFGNKFNYMDIAPQSLKLLEMTKEIMKIFLLVTRLGMVTVKCLDFTKTITLNS
jgi:hypothetical protein